MQIKLITPITPIIYINNVFLLLVSFDVKKSLIPPYALIMIPSVNIRLTFINLFICLLKLTNTVIVIKNIITLYLSHNLGLM